MKQYIPWPLKVFIKLLLGVFGVDYKILKRVGIVEHGRMENSEFSMAVFNRHVAIPIRDHGVIVSGRLLELGPGDSVATGLIGLKTGYSEVVLVDAGSFADLRPEAINRLFASFQIPFSGISETAHADEVVQQLASHGISYLTQGLESVKSLEKNSIHHSFSNSVLQHVHADILPQFLEALGRVHVKESLSSHSIKYDDHFSGGFINNVLPNWIMESNIVKVSNLYTNRVSPVEFADMFEAAGFAIKNTIIDFADVNVPAQAICKTNENLKNLVKNRLVLRTTFLLQKK